MPFRAYQELQERYDSLVREIVQMKREGFAQPVAEITRVPEKELPGEIRQAIARITEQGTATYEQLTHVAWQLEAQGLKAEAIIAHLDAGEPIEWST